MSAAVSDLLEDCEVREIAAAWHSWIVVPDALYALSSTGAIVGPETAHLYDGRRTTEQLLQETLDPDQDGWRDGGYWTAQDREDLEGLLAYVRHHGPRDRVKGWSS